MSKQSKVKKSKARKTSESPTRVWKFGALPPTTGAADVEDQVHRGRRYYNDLVALERTRRAAFDVARGMYAPELLALQAQTEDIQRQIDEVYAEIRAERQAIWRDTGAKSLAVSPEAATRLESLKDRIKVLYAEGAEARHVFSLRLKGARETYKARVDEAVKASGKSDPHSKSRINSQVFQQLLADPEIDPAWKHITSLDVYAQEVARDIKRRAGLASGTSSILNEAFRRAKEDTQHPFLQFKSAIDSKGCVAVQVTSAAGKPAPTVRDAMSGAIPNFELVAQAPTPGKKGKPGRNYVARINCAPGRAPKAEFPILLHRMPPPDAVIKWAKIIVKKCGERSIFELQLTLEHPSFAEPKRPEGTAEAQHIRLGWKRQMQSGRLAGVRVAAWGSGEVTLPVRILDSVGSSRYMLAVADQLLFGQRKDEEAFAVVTSVRQVLDRLLGKHKFSFRTWERLERDRDRIRFRQGWEDSATAHFGRGRLRELWGAWKQHQFASKMDLMQELGYASRWLRSQGLSSQTDRLLWWLYLWARKDRHLRQYSADMARRFTAQRDAHYRSEAIRVSTEFSSVSVDNYSVAALKEKEELKLEAVNPTAQRMLQDAAPGRFREILVSVMGARAVPCERPVDEEKEGVARIDDKCAE